MGFFERLEGQLEGINTLQRNVTKSYQKAKDAFAKYRVVQSFNMHAEGLI